MLSLFSCEVALTQFASHDVQVVLGVALVVVSVLTDVELSVVDSASLHNTLTKLAFVRQAQSC